MERTNIRRDRGRERRREKIRGNNSLGKERMVTHEKKQKKKEKKRKKKKNVTQNNMKLEEVGKKRYHHCSVFISGSRMS